MNKLILIITILLLVCGSISAQQLTTIAIVDSQRVYDSFAKGNSLLERINSVQARYEAQIDDQLALIRALEAEKRSLRPSRDADEIAAIDGRISTARAEIDRLSRLRPQEIDEQRQFIVPRNFIPQLQRAVIFVAESKGYTIVLNSDTQGLQWWSPVVDITDDVIARIVAQISQ